MGQYTMYYTYFKFLPVDEKKLQAPKPERSENP